MDRPLNHRVSMSPLAAFATTAFYAPPRTDVAYVKFVGLGTDIVNRSLLANVKSRKLRYFGHVMRGEDKSLEKGIIEGTLPRNRNRGRPRTVWIDNVTSWMYGTEA